MSAYIEAVSRFGKKIGLTKRHWDYIISKHESVIGLEEQVKETLKRPAYVRLSKEDGKVYLYYAPYKKYFLCVVCRHLNGEGFIITAYLTDKIKKGVTIYEAD
jgi:hypothetical protein